MHISTRYSIFPTVGFGPFTSTFSVANLGYGVDIYFKLKPAVLPFEELK